MQSIRIDGGAARAEEDAFEVKLLAETADGRGSAQTIVEVEVVDAVSIEFG